MITIKKYDEFWEAKIGMYNLYSHSFEGLLKQLYTVYKIEIPLFNFNLN